jgi:hypothetical protein
MPKQAGKQLSTRGRKGPPNLNPMHKAVALGLGCLSALGSASAFAASFTYQAESMARYGAYTAAGAVAQLNGKSGSVTQKFLGDSGAYNMTVYVQLENDGRPNLKVYNNNTLLRDYTYALGSNGTTASFTISNVKLTKYDNLRFYGTANGGAQARIDKILVTSAGTTATPTPPTTKPAPTPTPTPTPAPKPTPTPTPTPSASLPSTGTKAVATFESLGLYWTPPSNPGAAGCTIQYRKSGESGWKKGLSMWYDARNSECRGSLVQLSPGATYEVQFAMPGKAPVAALTARTWAEKFPIAKTVMVAGGSQPLNITQGGTASGYVLYTAPAGTTIDVGNNATSNITISAPYVIIRGLTLKGAKQSAITLAAGAHDVVVEDNDISGWGRYNYTNSAGWQIGVDGDAAVFCQNNPGLDRAIIQRNAMHDPRYGANSWSWGHPAGPQAVTFNTCGGNHVIRHNDIYSSDRHYFNDGIGGGDNFTTKGFPNYDTDIYGNKISQVWDDAIEAEGGNRNVRIWGNYMDSTTTGVATTVAHYGPVYVFRNVYNRSRMMSERAADQDDRNAFAKSGSGQGFGDGRRYVFHNTLLQAPPLPGQKLTSGAGIGLYGPASTQILSNTVSRNNIWHVWKTWWASVDTRGGAGNDADYDLFNGNVTAYSGAESHGIVGTPIYASGHGWSSEANGMYQLAPTSPGYDKGQVLPNFNDGYTGTGPDMGAHEGSTSAMRFGIKAGVKPY